ncbi:MAG: pirin family protein [Alphaproteobacteria bacterium]
MTNVKQIVTPAPPRPRQIRTLAAEQQIGPDLMPSRRPFAPDRARNFDPFLMFVHFGPREVRETQWGFAPHPHAGFETITYMLRGELEHHDTTGGHAILNEGDVQWMTAGRGIVHSEIPPAAFVNKGGIVNGFQIWLNLPDRDRKVEPGFQMLRAADMPIVKTPDGKASARLIAGKISIGGGPEATGKVTTFFPVTLYHVTIQPGGTWPLGFDPAHTAFAYVIDGAGTLTTDAGQGALAPGQILLLNDALEIAGDVAARAANENPRSPPQATGNKDSLTLSLSKGEDRATIANDAYTLACPADAKAPLNVLFLSGQPHHEPVVSYGPFVMSSKEGIMQAIRDYNDGKMGA